MVDLMVLVLSFIRVATVVAANLIAIYVLLALVPFIGRFL